jgi:hypothetical protein
MEINEEVAKLEAATKDSLCKHKDEPEKRNWKCRIGKDVGDLPKPSAARLRHNMGKEPYPKSTKWKLSDCNPNHFPPEYHHLIPKNHLPDHPVCVWLAQKAGNGEWQLTGSTTYDTDAADNGVALPNATPTTEWKKAAGKPIKENEICEMMMDLTGMQLHQGNHTYDDYDEGDDNNELKAPGYLGAVDELLDVIDGQALTHYKGCPYCCKNSESKPIQAHPLERIVASMHHASTIMEHIIKTNKRFVSQRAAAHIKKRPHLLKNIKRKKSE